jgi:hypothetical protein
LSTLERWEPRWRFLERWVVITGFCKGDFSMTNEQQCHLKEKLISELLEEVESIKISKKITFFTPQQKCNNISDFRLGVFLSAFGEDDVQSFTVVRWTDFLPYIVNSRNGQ